MYVKNKNNINKITINDLIQEVAYQNSKRNKFSDKQRRRQGLDNYFKDNSYIPKFPSKHKIEKAIKNINYEMERHHKNLVSYLIMMIKLSDLWYNTYKSFLII